MAERPVFISSVTEKGYVSIQDIKFEWFPGFSVKQKQRSIESFHKNFKDENPSSNVLEISSKSDKELGVSLSAFNLMIKTKTLRCLVLKQHFKQVKFLNMADLL